MASSEEDMPDLAEDSSGESEDDEKPDTRQKYPAHQPQAPFNAKPSAQDNNADDDDDLPELLDGGSDEEEDDEDDDEPPPLVGESDEDEDSDDERSNGRGYNKTKPDGPSLPGLKAGFFAKPKPPPQPAPPPAPAAASRPSPAPAAAQPQGPSSFSFNSTPKFAAKAAPPPAAKAAPPPAGKPPPRRKDGEVEEASDGNDSEEVPDLLEADDEDEDSGSEPPDSEPEQESDEEEEHARPTYGAQRGGPRRGSFYPDFESEERAIEERRKREAERKRKEEERARERAERKRREQEEKKRRQAEAKKRQMEDAAVYANSPEARELAEQARLRAEAEMEEKRLQMGLGPREKTLNEGEEEIGPAYFCRGTHCPGNQRMLTKTQEYIEFRCTERCLLLYHTGDCHRKDVKLKMEREHGVWKEEEGARCITPDCPGTLTNGTKWNRFGKVSYQIIDPEKYEKKRREKERLRAEEKAAKQAAKAAAASKRSKKQEKHDEEELEGFAKFRRSTKSRTFTNFSFQGATQAVATDTAAEPIPEEAPVEAKETKAEAEEAPRKRGKKKNADGGAPVVEANGGAGGAGSSGGHEEGSGGGGAPGIAVLVKAPLRPVAERELDDGEVTEYRKKEDEDNVFTLGNKDRTKDKGKQKVDAVPEPPPAAAAKGKGKKKGMTLSINEFITSDDPDPPLSLRPQGAPSASRPFINDPGRPFMNGDFWRGPPMHGPPMHGMPMHGPHMHGPPMHGPVPVVHRQPQEDFPELHRGPGGTATTPSAPGFQERPKDPFSLALDSIRIRDTEPTRHLVLEDVDGRADDEEIRSLLWEYGMVEEMTRFRGREIAFVTMRTVEEAASARLLLPNRSLKNRKVKLDSVSQHPSPSFFANYQPQWAAHDLITPRTKRPSPLAAPFIPGGAGPSHQSLDGSEQWEEFEWSATGEDAFAAGGASDWGSEAPVGSFGSSGGEFGLRAAAARGKMKPDAPEFVPKSVLLAQTKQEPKSEAKAEASGSKGESSGAGSSSESASSAKVEEASKRPVSAPMDEREAVAGINEAKGKEAVGEKETADRPGSAPLRASDQAKGKGIALEEGRPTSAPKTTPPAGKDAGTEERPTSAPTAASPKRNGMATEALTGGGSFSKMESARDTPAAGTSGREALTSSGAARLDSARGVLGSGGARIEPGRSLLGPGSGRLESARDLLGSGGDTRPRSTSPVVPLPPSLLAVQAGRLPMLNRPCNFAMGQIIATTTETLALYQDSIRLDRDHLVQGCQIIPHACALFLFNIEELELHGFYEATSGSYLQCRDPYTGIMYGVEQPHIAFRCVRRFPVPLGRTEIEPLLPPGWWNADTWLLPLVLPALQTEMLLLLFEDKAEYEERKKRGFAEELEGQLEIAQAAAGPPTPPLPSGIPRPTPANAVVAAQSPPTAAPKEEALSASAAVPATIAAAARGAAENGTGNKAANGMVEEIGEGSGSAGAKTEIPGASSGVPEKAPVASASGLQAAKEDRPASAKASGTEAPKAEANGRVATPPKAAPAQPSSSGSAKEPAAKPSSPSTPLSPQPSPSPLHETATSGRGAPDDITSILAEITSAASGWGGESPTIQPAASIPPKSAPGNPRTPPPGVQTEERVPTPQKREGARPASGTPGAEERSTSLPTEGGGASTAEAAAPNMQSILDMLLPKAAPSAPAPAPPVSAPHPPAGVRPYRPPVKYNPLGQAPPSSNGRVSTPPARESPPPLVDERTACKLCWVRKADFFIKECGHMGPCLSCFEDPRINSNHCPQCRRKIATGDPTKFIRMFR